jgi:translation initiation factor IF-1
MGKSFKKAKVSAERKNKTLNTIVLTDEGAVFGRIVKKLGNGRFRIQVPDKKGHGSEADAAVVGKSVSRVDLGDVVVVGRNESAGKISYEILGACDKASVKLLRDAKRLHPTLFADGDEEGEDLFDRSGDVGGEDDGAVKAKIEKGNKPVKPSKITAAEEEDVNVDDI